MYIFISIYIDIYISMFIYRVNPNPKKVFM